MTMGSTNYPAALDDSTTLGTQVNNCGTTLASGSAIAAASLSLTDASLFPSTGGFIYVGGERALYTGKATNTLTGVSGLGNVHNAGDAVELRVDAVTFNAMRDAVVALEATVGVTGGFNFLNTAGANLTGPVNANRANNVASASTTNIGAATGEYVHVTGTTTVTAFDTVQAGAERTVVFDGILTLTHNATSLILPTAANIMTAAGDSALFRSEGAGNWRCIDYVRADGTPPTGFSATTPGMNGAAAVGTAKTPARSDHVHPTDTSRAADSAVLKIANNLSDLNSAVTARANLGIAATTTAKSANYTVVAADRGIYLDCTGTITLALTASATLGNGFLFMVRNSGVGIVTIDPNAAETIDGASTIALAANDGATILCDGAGWH